VHRIPSQCHNTCRCHKCHILRKGCHGRLRSGRHVRLLLASKRPATTRGECDGCLLCSGPARHAHALVSQGDARTSARVRVRTSHARAAAAASTRQVVLGRQPVRQQDNIRGMRTPVPRAPLGSPPAAETLWQALTTRIHRVKDGALTLSGTQFQERIYTRVCTRCCL
jgi:hypothetical protein